MFQPFAETARAKINLALHVLGRRADGYHELDSIVAFADVGDVLTFAQAEEFVITADGPFAAALPASNGNIIGKAWEKATEIATARGRTIPPAAVQLTKNLPVASGIGGGSANAAAALRGFLKLAGIGTLDDEIMAAALTLGADVPVCLLGKACRMQGVGERITEIKDFAPRHALLVNPGIEVSTLDVFGQLGLEKGQRFGLPIADAGDPGCWRNDLTAPAIAIAPVIAAAIAALQQQPDMLHVGMSGSGATCFGVSNRLQPQDLQRAGWWSVPTTIS